MNADNECKEEVPRQAEVCKQLGVSVARKPASGLYAQMCIQISLMCGVSGVCSKAVAALGAQSLSIDTLASELKCRRRSVQLLVKHLVDKHGIVYGLNSIGFPSNVTYDADVIDGFVASVDPVSLRGRPREDVPSLAKAWFDWFPVKLHANNWKMVLQAWINLWIWTNFPGVAEAATFGENIENIKPFLEVLIRVLWWLFECLTDIVYVFRGHIVVAICLYFAALTVNHYVCLFWGWLTNWQAARERHRRFLLECRKLRDGALEYDRLREEILQMDCSAMAKMRVWIERGFDPKDLKPTKVIIPSPYPECAHPAAMASALPPGTVVELYNVINGKNQRVGNGAVLAVGDRIRVVTAGHVSDTWMKFPSRIIRFHTYFAEKWITQEVRDPVVVDYTPGALYGASTFYISNKCDEKIDKICAFNTGAAVVDEACHYWRRGVCATAKDVRYDGNILTYKGDTQPGDSGTPIYQRNRLIALHQGTYDPIEFVNFASLGVNVRESVSKLSDGYAEAMTAAPRFKKREKYMLKAAAYDGQSFGVLLDSSPWYFLWDFMGSEKLIVVDQFHYITGQLLFVPYNLWVAYGKPLVIKKQFLDDVREEKQMPFLHGKSWSPKLFSQLVRLIGKKVYPVPVPEGAATILPCDIIDQSIWNPKGGQGESDRARKVLLARYYVEHGMVMEKDEWNQIRTQTYNRTVSRRRLVTGADGVREWQNSEEIVGSAIWEKVPKLSKLVSRAQFFDKEFFVHLYASALDAGLITKDQIPNVISGFGRREIDRWLRDGVVEQKEWYLKFAHEVKEEYLESGGPKTEMWILYAEPGMPDSSDEDSDDEEENLPPNAAGESSFREEADAEPCPDPPVEESESEEKSDDDKPKVPSPPQFRETHAVSKDPIPLARFVALETEVKRLVEMMSEVLSQTDRHTADQPDLKTMLMDAVTELAKRSNQAIGKTIADVHCPREPVEMITLACNVCDFSWRVPLRDEQDAWSVHYSSNRHQKAYNRKLAEVTPPPQILKARQKESPSSFECECGARVTLKPEDVQLHMSGKKHLEFLHETKKDAFSFLGIGPAQKRGHKPFNGYWRRRTLSRNSVDRVNSLLGGQPSGSRPILGETQSSRPNFPQESIPGGSSTFRREV